MNNGSMTREPHLKQYKVLERWPVERVRAEALKHRTMFSFMNRCWIGYYKACQYDVWRPGFLEDITQHMEKRS